MTDPDVTHLPSAKDVRDLLEGLLGRDVTLTPSDPFAEYPPRGLTYALFVGQDYQLRAMAVCDLPLAARISAAIGLIPRGGADAAIEDGVLSQTMCDNLYEVMNVLSATFNAGGAHVKLTTVHHADETVDPQVRQWAATSGGRLDLAADISGYGAGALSLIVVR